MAGTDGPALLAFDTSAAHCAAAVICGADLRAAALEPMARGQAERILVLCGELLDQAGMAYADLAAIGVGVGPGNFTGIRISVSAARGLALGLGVPAIPVSAFETLRDPEAVPPAAELRLISAPRDTVYAQLFRDGRPAGEPVLIDPAAPPMDLACAGLCVVGHRAEEVARGLGAVCTALPAIPPAEALARVAAWKLALGLDLAARPAPLYVRAPDAAPARDLPPRIIA